MPKDDVSCMMDRVLVQQEGNSLIYNILGILHIRSNDVFSLAAFIESLLQIYKHYRQ